MADMRGEGVTVKIHLCQSVWSRIETSGDREPCVLWDLTDRVHVNLIKYIFD